VHLMLESLAFAFAVACAALMGFAIQRGATCTVAAVDDLMVRRSVARLASLLEAAVWVGGGLLVARTLHRLPALPAGYPLSARTVAGAALLGVGAFVNGACVFGAVARLGSGQWAYALTPLGYYAGCASVDRVLGSAPTPRLPYGSPVLEAPAWVAALFVAFVLWRVAAPLPGLWRSAAAAVPGAWREALRGRIWSAHAATTVIGLAFLALLLVAGSWAYTDVLAELARGMVGDVVTRSVLLAALLGGAVLGGWTAGRLGSARIAAAQLLRCFGGGMLMGWGSLLIPGGNDGLILVGMPLAWPYAWLAFATMCTVIAAAQWLCGSGPRSPR